MSAASVEFLRERPSATLNDATLALMRDHIELLRNVRNLFGIEKCARWADEAVELDWALAELRIEMRRRELQ